MAQNILKQKGCILAETNEEAKTFPHFAVLDDDAKPSVFLSDA
jgi:hypothetical protein